MSQHSPGSMLRMRLAGSLGLIRTLYKPAAGRWRFRYLHAHYTLCCADVSWGKPTEHIVCGMSHILTPRSRPFVWGGCAGDMQTSHCYIFCRWILWMMCLLQTTCKMRCSSLQSAMPAWYLLSTPLLEMACLHLKQNVQHRICVKHRRLDVNFQACGHGQAAFACVQPYRCTSSETVS